MPLPTHPPKKVDPGYPISDVYLLGSEIGKGASGSVYECQNRVTGETIAAKRISMRNLKTEQLRELEHEIALLKKLNHPNIVKYIGTVKTKNHMHILLEYMENGSLLQKLKKYGAFHPRLVSLYTRQVLKGLDYLHGQGVIHRDIKGANILSTKSGLVKLADFGVATYVTLKAGGTSDNVQGTPYWMAPEIIEMSNATYACDVWSVGCTVVELLTTKPPYYDIPPMAALYRIVQDPQVPLPEDLDDDIIDFLQTCFVKDPNHRATVQQLLDHPWVLSSKGKAKKKQSQENALQQRQNSVDDEGTDIGDHGGDAIGSSGGIQAEQQQQKQPQPQPQPQPPQQQRQQQRQRQPQKQTGTGHNAGDNQRTTSPTSTSATAGLHATSGRGEGKDRDKDQDEQPTEPDKVMYSSARRSESPASESEQHQHVQPYQQHRMPSSRSSSVANAATRLSQVSRPSHTSVASSHRSTVRSSLPGEVYDTESSSYPQVLDEGPSRVSWGQQQQQQQQQLLQGSSRPTSKSGLGGVHLETLESVGEDLPEEDWDKEFGIFEQSKRSEGSLIKGAIGTAWSGPLRVDKQNAAEGDGRAETTGTGGVPVALNGVRPGVPVEHSARHLLASPHVHQLVGSVDSREIEAVFVDRDTSDGDGHPNGDGNVNGAGEDKYMYHAQDYDEQDQDQDQDQDQEQGQDHGQRPRPEQGRASGHGRTRLSLPSSVSKGRAGAKGLLARYQETESDSTLDELAMSDGGNNAGSTGGGRPGNQNGEFHRRRGGGGGEEESNNSNTPQPRASTAGELRRRLSQLPINIPAVAPGFSETSELSGRVDDREDLGADSWTMRANEVESLVGQLDARQHSEDTILSSCDLLLAMFQEQPKLRRTLLSHHGVIPILEALEVPGISHSTVQALLTVVANISEQQQAVLEVMAMAGLVPIIARYCSPGYVIHTRLSAASVVKNFIETSNAALQMFVACGGLPVIAALLQPSKGSNSSDEEPSPSTSASRKGKGTSTDKKPKIPPSSATHPHPHPHPLAQAQAQAQAQTKTYPYGGGQQLEALDVSLALVALEGILRVFKLRTASNGASTNAVGRSSISSHAPKEPSPKLVATTPTVSAEGEGNDREPRRRSSISARVPKNDFTRLFVKVGIMDRIAELLDFLRSRKGKETCASANITAGRLIKYATDVLLTFSQGGQMAKRKFASLRIMRSMLATLNDIGSNGRQAVQSRREASYNVASATNLLKCIKFLSMEPVTLDALENAGAIPILIPFLDLCKPKTVKEVIESNARNQGKNKGGENNDDQLKGKKKGKKSGPMLGKKNKDPTPLISWRMLPSWTLQECYNLVMLTLFYLCRLSYSRQEQATVSGIVPCLVETVNSFSPVRTFAIQMLCDLAFVSPFTRFHLWRNDVLNMFLDLLIGSDIYWCEKALGAIEVWLLNGTVEVERAMLRPQSLSRIITFFQSAHGSTFDLFTKILLEMLKKSDMFAQALSRSGLFMVELAFRLDYPTAEVKINLLKILMTISQHSEDVEYMILEHNLFQIVNGIAQQAKTSKQVLVKEVAGQILDQWTKQIPEI